MHKICGITFVKIKDAKGITLLTYHNGETKSKLYPAIEDIKGFKVSVFEGENAIELKTVTISEKVVS